MKRAIVVAILACVTGCSNAPIAGLLECVLPSKPAEPRLDIPRGPGGPDDRIPPAELGPPTGPGGSIVPKIGP